MKEFTSRIFMDDTAADHSAIQSVLSQVVFYPLSEFDKKMKTKDWSKLPHFPAPPSLRGGCPTESQNALDECQ